MWLALTRGDRCRLTLTDRQSIWPAPDGSDAELVITTEALILQEVVLATPRVVRLRYGVEQIGTTMTLGDQPPAPWRDANAVRGRGFEIMITERGPLMVPEQGEKLPNKQAAWLQTVAEDVRSSWTVPPEKAVVGTEWKLAPVIPGGLPSGTTSVSFDVTYRVTALDRTRADVAVTFAVAFGLDVKPIPGSGEGRGEMTVRIDGERGVHEAHRTGRVVLVRSSSLRNQVLRSAVDLRRL